MQLRHLVGEKTTKQNKANIRFEGSNQRKIKSGSNRIVIRFCVAILFQKSGITIRSLRIRTADCRYHMCASNAVVDSILACSHDRWLPLFRRHVLRSIILPLPEGFLEYLSEDGVFLGEASDAASACLCC